jgi:hypothetical protein
MEKRDDEGAPWVPKIFCRAGGIEDQALLTATIWMSNRLHLSRTAE